MKKLLITAFMALFSLSSQCGTILINPVFYIISKIMGTSTIQGSGIPKTQHLPIEGIRQVSVYTSGNLFIKQCENPQDCIEQLVTTADDNILDILQSRMNGSKLELSSKDRVSFSPQTPIQYHLTLKNIDSIAQNGSSNITSSSLTAESLNITSSGNASISIQDISAKELKIKKSGSGDIQVKIHTDNLEVDHNGNGNIKLEGDTNHQEIRISGSVNYNTKNLESNTVSFSAFGNGNIHLNAKESIKGSLYGNVSGTYNEKHTPEVNVRTYGSGRFKKSSW